jgi:phosphoserine phosphatase
MRTCRWHCGQQTKNISGICDLCWTAAELLRSNTDEGYRAWVERKKAKQAKETEANVKKPMSQKQRAALDKARRAKLLKQLPVAELSDILEPIKIWRAKKH